MTTHTAPLPMTSPAEWSAGQRRFLYWAVILSALLHLALLTWNFSGEQSAQPLPSEIEVVMVNAQTESTPAVAHLLAQSNVDGGGDAPKGYSSNRLAHGGHSPDDLTLEALVKKRLQLETQQQELLTLLKAQQTAQEGRPNEHFLKDTDRNGPDQDDQEAILRNNRIAVLTHQIEQYSERPRKHFDAPSARQMQFAPYIDQWRLRVEQIGTQHYPKGVGDKVYGSVQATLTIRADGSLADIQINRPSDKALLNQAVRRIAQLAAPFAAFPQDMASQIDELVLTRTWHFVNGSVTTK
jgi:protein TonB